MSDKTIVTVPHDKNGKKIVFSGSQNYPRFILDLGMYLQGLGLKVVLGPDSDGLVPIRPDKAYERRNGLGATPPHPDDNINIHRFEVADQIWTSKCEKVLSIFNMCHSDEICGEVEAADPTFNIATRITCKRFGEIVSALYCTYSVPRCNLNKAAMALIPRFTTPSSVFVSLKELADINLERVSWNTPGVNYGLSDAEIRGKIMTLMGGNKDLATLLELFEDNPDWTSSKCKDKLVTKVRLIRSKELEELATNKMNSSLQVMSSNVVISEAPKSWHDHSQQTYEQNIYSPYSNHSSVPYEPAVYMSSIHNADGSCDNCQLFGHIGSRCPTPYCRNCKGRWATNSPGIGYHFWMQCPNLLQSYPNRSRGMSNYPSRQSYSGRQPYTPRPNNPFPQSHNTRNLSTSFSGNKRPISSNPPTTSFSPAAQSKRQRWTPPIAVNAVVEDSTPPTYVDEGGRGVWTYVPYEVRETFASSNQVVSLPDQEQLIVNQATVQEEQEDMWYTQRNI